MPALVVAVQAGLAFIFSSLGLSTAEWAVLPVGVAVYTARGRFGWAAALVAVAVLGGALGQVFALSAHGPRWWLALYYGLAAGLGGLLGLGMRRRWTFGRTVAVAAAAGGVVLLAGVFASWDQWVGEAASLYENWQSMSTALRDMQQPGPEQEMQRERVMDALQWLLVDHWADLGLGLMFGQLLLTLCVALSAACFWVRRRGGPPARGRFRTMRLPEWFVWVAIAVAGLWFLDRQAPAFGLRPLVWNAAAGVAAVYWVHGVAIMLFALVIVQPNAFLFAALLLSWLLLCGSFWPAAIGLADTWADFRRRMRAWKVTVRRAQRRQGL